MSVCGFNSIIKNMFNLMYKEARPIYRLHKTPHLKECGSRRLKTKGRPRYSKWKKYESRGKDSYIKVERSSQNPLNMTKKSS